jgi:hypothetical protein
VSLVAGIDYSTHAIDVVTIDEDTLKPEWHRLDLRGQDAFERSRDARVALMPSMLPFDWDDVVAVGIEQPRGNHGVTYLFRVQGAILASIPSATLVQPWNPSEWRKAVGLKGNASKQDVRDFASAELRRELRDSEGSWGKPYEDTMVGWPQDAMDAWCIARATLQALERNET